jgi:hypothetical protein
MKKYLITGTLLTIFASNANAAANCNANGICTPQFVEDGQPIGSARSSNAVNSNSWNGFRRDFMDPDFNGAFHGSSDLIDLSGQQQDLTIETLRPGQGITGGFQD